MINNPMTPPVRTLAELGPIVPELFVVLGAFALLMLDLFIDPRRRIITHVLAVAVLLVTSVRKVTGRSTVSAGPAASISAGTWPTSPSSRSPCWSG